MRTSCARRASCADEERHACVRTNVPPELTDCIRSKRLTDSAAGGVEHAGVVGARADPTEAPGRLLDGLLERSASRRLPAGGRGVPAGVLDRRGGVSTVFGRRRSGTSVLARKGDVRSVVGGRRRDRQPNAQAPAPHEQRLAAQGPLRHCSSLSFAVSAGTANQRVHDARTLPILPTARAPARLSSRPLVLVASGIVRQETSTLIGSGPQRRGGER